MQNNEEQRIPLASIPLTRNGTIGFQIENAMAAVAAAWALGVDWETIRSGLASFVNDAQTAPGRFNFFDYRGASVIADYGHNPDAMLALVPAIESIPAKQAGGRDQRSGRPARCRHPSARPRYWAMCSTRSSCIRTNASAAAPTARCWPCCSRGLGNAKRTRHIDEITGEFLAIDTALSRLQAGDLCLVLIDQVDEALAHIAQRVAGA